MTKISLGMYFFGMLGLLIGLPMDSALSADTRVAMIVGNSGYIHSRALKNPRQDGDALSETFTRLGFRVIQGQDLSKSAMQDRLHDFYEALEEAAVGVFFYAGHGLQLNSKNFLVPVGFDPKEDALLGDQLIGLESILKEMTSRTPVNLVFLDACRDNPFTTALNVRMETGRSVAIDQQRGVQVVGTGLAEVKGRTGTLIAYATQPGNVALDGAGENSPFTLGLLDHIETPGLEVRDLLIRVRASVVKETNGAQIPWDHSSLMERFYFKQKIFRAPPPP